MQQKEISIDHVCSGRIVTIPLVVHFGDTEDTRDRVDILANRIEGLDPNELEQLQAQLYQDHGFYTQAVIKARTQAGFALIVIHRLTGEIAFADAALSIPEPRGIYWIQASELGSYAAARVRSMIGTGAKGPWQILRMDQISAERHEAKDLDLVIPPAKSLETLQAERKAGLLAIVHAIIPKLADDPETLAEVLEPLEALIRPMRQELGGRQALRIQMHKLSDEARAEITEALHKAGEPEAWESDRRPIVIIRKDSADDAIRHSLGTIHGLARTLTPWIRDLTAPELDLAHVDLQFKGGRRVTLHLEEPSAWIEPENLTPDQMKDKIDAIVGKSVETLTALAPHLTSLILEIDMSNPAQITASMQASARAPLDAEIAGSIDDGENYQMQEDGLENGWPKLDRKPEPLIQTGANPPGVYSLDDLRAQLEARKLEN